MRYEDLVRDFATRTRKNLYALRELQRTNPDVRVYEVTQLINSLLGLLVFPQQRYIDRIEALPLEELVSRGWPIPQVIGEYPQVEDLNQLVRYLRNSIAHCNLEIVSDGYGEIRGLKVWNTRAGRVTWKAQLSTDDIEKIGERFIEMLTEEISSKSTPN